MDEEQSRESFEAFFDTNINDDAKREEAWFIWEKARKVTEIFMKG